MPQFGVFAATLEVATTTILVSICGDANVAPGEACDLGVASNTGVYSLTISGRTCNSDCLAFAPYCGDNIVQTIHGEACDDGNNSDGDFCDAVCQDEPFTTSSGGGGGGGFAGGSFIPAPNATVSISGKAYPNADVNILQDGEVIGIVQADAAANFFFSSSDITPGTVTFGFWAEDANQLRSISFNTTFQVAQSAVTNINNILLPPTIELNSRSFDPGDELIISGQSVPEVDLNSVVSTDEDLVTSETITDEDGFWETTIDTSTFEEELHTAKAQFFTFLDGSEVASGFSQALTFFIGDVEEGFVGPSDRDGSVNLIDFSILLFHWGTDGADSDPPADINLSGNVDLTDFSIMIFNWTG